MRKIFVKGRPAVPPKEGGPKGGNGETDRERAGSVLAALERVMASPLMRHRTDPYGVPEFEPTPPPSVAVTGDTPGMRGVASTLDEAMAGWHGTTTGRRSSREEGRRIEPVQFRDFSVEVRRNVQAMTYEVSVRGHYLSGDGTRRVGAIERVPEERERGGLVEDGRRSDLQVACDQIAGNLLLEGVPELSAAIYSWASALLRRR